MGQGVQVLVRLSFTWKLGLRAARGGHSVEDVFPKIIIREWDSICGKGEYFNWTFNWTQKV